MIIESNYHKLSNNSAFNIAYGSYIGTGTYGSRYTSAANAQISITADFNIKAVIIFDSTGAFLRFAYADCLVSDSYTKGFFPVDSGGNINTYAKKSEDGKTVYWYSIHSTTMDVSSYQCNTADAVYYYIVFG